MNEEARLASAPLEPVAVAGEEYSFEAPMESPIGNCSSHCNCEARNLSPQQ